jgi:hypothetical protein
LYYIVELRMTGLGVSLSYTDRVTKHVVTSIYRLSKYERSQLQYLKVKLYRVLDRLASFQLDDSYVLHAKRLREFEEEFREVYEEFKKIRRRVYEEVVQNWPTIRQGIVEFLSKAGNPDMEERLRRIDPPESEEGLAELSYRLIPLNFLLKMSEMGVIDDEPVKERVRAEAEKIRREVERQYQLKILKLEETIAEFEKKMREQEEQVRKLRSILRSREHYLAKLDGLIREAEDVEEILGEETAEELRNRVEALKLRLLGGSGYIELR